MSRILSPSGGARSAAMLCCLLLAFVAGPPLEASGGRDTDSAYHLGKSLMERRLACDGCALDRAPRSRAEAQSVHTRLRNGEIGGELSGRERWAVRVYLEERWKLDRGEPE